MSWPLPFRTFDLDTGVVQVPTITGVITASAGWLMGINLTNTSTDTIWVDLIEGTGGIILSHIEVTPGGPLSIPWTLYPIPSGVKWIASAAGVYGKVWGYI